jgi:hypothetical protein
MRDYWARLRTSLPPDWIEQDGVEIRQGGLNVLAVVAEAWLRVGFGRPEIVDAGDHGWSQFCRREKVKVWSQVTCFSDDVYLLGVSDCTADLKRMGWRTFRDEILGPLNLELRSDNRLTEVNWIEPEDILGEGGVFSPADPSLSVNKTKGFWRWPR